MEQASAITTGGQVAEMASRIRVRVTAGGIRAPELRLDTIGIVWQEED